MTATNKASAGGDLILYQVGFNDLTNTTSVSSGTLQIFSWNELQTPSGFSLASALDTSSIAVQLVAASATYSPYVGQIIQVGTELMTVVAVDAGTNTYTVVRGALGSTPSAHNAGDSLLHLDAIAQVVPFASGFFANKASINYLHVVSMPDMRVCAAEFYVTNSFGNSQANAACYTTGPDGGLRTLSGGQFSLQVSGFLMTQQNAAPPLFIEASHAVRDIRAIVSQASTGYNILVDVLQNGLEYCSMTIASGNTTSAPIVNGVNLSALQEGASITMNVTLEGVSGYSGTITPGRDLTVTIRL